MKKKNNLERTLAYKKAALITTEILETINGGGSPFGITYVLTTIITGNPMSGGDSVFDMRNDI